MAAVAESEGFHQETLDPRIQTELEKLNKASEDINRLELELDEARAAFRQVLTESTQKLNTLAKKCGTCIEKARPYYDARIRAKEAQVLTQNAALRYDRASSQLAAAKEMVHLAEQGFFKKGQPFDPAWQEMLNHATMKVNDAEQERLEGEIEHRQTASYFNEAEQKVKQLQKDLKRAIAKSRPYFELKAKVNHQMEDQKQRVGFLEKMVNGSKATYSEALHSLETISDEIHQQRSEAKMRQSMGARGSGVGAEAPSPPPPSERRMLKHQGGDETVPGAGYPRQPASPLATSDQNRDLVPSELTSVNNCRSQHRHKTADASSNSVQFRNLPNTYGTGVGARANPQRRLTVHSSVSLPSTEPEFQVPDGVVPGSKHLPKRGSAPSCSTPSSSAPAYQGRETAKRPSAVTMREHPSLISRSVSDKTGERVPKVPLLRVQLSTPSTDSAVVSMAEIPTSPDLETGMESEQAKTFRTNAEVMASVQRAKATNKPFLRPNRSRDSLLDETSDTESLTGSLASVSMLDDEQVESLMQETGEYMKFLAKMDEARKAKWKRLSLPGKLTYLEEFMKRTPDWLAEYQRDAPESDEVFLQREPEPEGAVAMAGVPDDGNMKANVCCAINNANVSQDQQPV